MRAPFIGLIAATIATVGLVGCGAASVGSAPPKEVTLVAFQQIHDGMSLAQVQTILGGPGKVTLSIKVKNPPITTEDYQWGDVATGYWVTIGFQNDAAMMEMEFGL